MSRGSVAAPLALCLGLLIFAVAEPASDITLKDVTVSLLESDGAAAATQKLTAEGAAQGMVLDHTRTLKVSFSAGHASEADFRPQQAFLRLSHAASGEAAYFAAIRAKDGSLYTTAKSSDIQKQVGLQGGTFTADLLLGDSRSAQPLQRRLGEVTVLHAPLDDGSQPAAAPYRAMDALFQPLPEIVHMHRAPERRAPAAVSLAFAALALAPAAVYVVVALQLGANLKGFPTGSGALVAAGFHAGLLAIMGLYILFWLRLNLLQMLPILAGLAAVTAVFGHATLGRLGEERPKQD